MSEFTVAVDAVGKLERGEKVSGNEMIKAAEATYVEGLAEAAKMADSEAAAEMKLKVEEAYEYAQNEAGKFMNSEEAAAMRLKAEELAKRAIGEEAVAEVTETVEKVAGMIDDKAVSDISATLKGMAESDIPDDVKEKIAARTGKVWDQLSNDDKTRELAASLVRNINASACDERVLALRTQILKSVESKESVNDVMRETQKMMEELQNSDDTKDIMKNGGQVWESIESNDEFWSIIMDSKNMLQNVKVGADESILDNPEVLKLRQRGEALYVDMVQTDEAKALIEKSQKVLMKLWTQAMGDLGITGSIEDFLASGQEIWNQIDHETLQQVMSTVLKGAVELVLEFVPNMDLPRICGFYSSPIGQVVYQLASMQFSSFDLSPEGVQIQLGQKLSLQVDGISATINDFQWQFAKSSWPFLTGEGAASVRVSDCSIALEYGMTFEQGRVVLLIFKQEIHLRKFEMSVAETTAGWLYNMILQVLNTQLRVLLETKLLSIAVTKLQEMADYANTISKGFLTISMTEDLKHCVSKGEEQSDDEERAYKVLMDTFHSSSKLGQEVFRVDSLSLKPFLTSLHGVPKVLLFSTQEKGIPPLYTELFKLFHEGLLFGIVSSTDTKLQREYKVETTPKLLVITEESDSPVLYEGKLVLEEISTFLAHFCVAFTRVTPVSNFSMKFYLEHCPQDTPLVMLYTERDDMPPLYKELAKNFRMFLFAIIRHTDTEMVKRFNITSYPTIKVRPTAKDEGIQYTGQITPTAVHNWLVKFIMDMNTIVKVSKDTVDMYFSKEPQKPKVLLFTAHKDTPPLYEDLWKRFRMNMCFGIVFEPEQEMLDRFGVTDLPALFKVRAEDATPVKYESQINVKGVTEFLADYADRIR